MPDLGQRMAPLLDVGRARLLNAYRELRPSAEFRWPADPRTHSEAREWLRRDELLGWRNTRAQGGDGAVETARQVKAALDARASRTPQRDGGTEQHNG